jgi:hypothetical protein
VSGVKHSYRSGVLIVAITHACCPAQACWKGNHQAQHRNFVAEEVYFAYATPKFARCGVLFL